ncbi:MAG: glycerophosphodiester phosphodiesterase [Candidatus Accumulibacter sp.]|jgi:glycerophosphoryl diester phosphodiesterase|nr:glycerophosphodiester phosphodiesterase [Accumulibacter sp.]
MGVMQIWGHRGAYRQMPENTLPGFAKAIELGADGVEFDVQLTKDGEVVVIHDETLDRTSDASGFVRDYTLCDLKNFNFNKRGISEPKFMAIPTLDEVLELLKPSGIDINIELKTGVHFYEGLEQKCVELVGKYSLADRIIWSSFNHCTVEKVKRIDSTAKTALLCGGGILVSPALCKKAGIDGVHPNIRQLDYPGYVDKCKSIGIVVRTWTVDSDDDFNKAKSFGVDAVFVNDLERHKELGND